jgi:hypothetical protein
MRVDPATLSDLAILDSDLDGSSLFALLDRTATKIRRSRLRRRMRELPGSTQELRDCQDAVRYLALAREAPRQVIEVLRPDLLDSYLGLRWQTLTARTAVTRIAERVVLRMGYRDALRQISEGVSALRTMVDGLPILIELLAGGSMRPEPLRTGTVGSVRTGCHARTTISDGPQVPPAHPGGGSIGAKHRRGSLTTMCRDCGGGRCARRDGVSNSRARVVLSRNRR